MLTRRSVRRDEGDGVDHRVAQQSWLAARGTAQHRHGDPAPDAAVDHPHLRLLQLGDDTAPGLGVNAERTRAIAIGVAVAFASLATAAAGPITFVAFVAPPIARRLTRQPLTILPAALVGATVLLASDLIGRRILPARAAVGVVTGLIGAPYLLWLLAAPTRRAGAAEEHARETREGNASCAIENFTPSPLRAEGLTLSYDRFVVAEGPVGRDPGGHDHVHRRSQRLWEVDAVAGAARLLKPKQGAVLLDGQEIHRLPARGRQTSRDPAAEPDRRRASASPI